MGKKINIQHRSVGSRLTKTEKIQTLSVEYDEVGCCQSVCWKMGFEVKQIGKEKRIEEYIKRILHMGNKNNQKQDSK